MFLHTCLELTDHSKFSFYSVLTCFPLVAVTLCRLTPYLFVCTFIGNCYKVYPYHHFSVYAIIPYCSVPHFSGRMSSDYILLMYLNKYQLVWRVHTSHISMCLYKVSVCTKEILYFNLDKLLYLYTSSCDWWA